MSNLKHTAAALAAITLVGSLSVMQSRETATAKATKLTEDYLIIESAAPAVLTGDGDGETADFNEYLPKLQALVGKEAYILTSGGSINLRKAADVESTILNVLQVGTSLEILDIDGDWFKVKVGDYTGYVKSEFVSLDYDSVETVLLRTTMYRKATADKTINVYAGASDSEVILDLVPQGDWIYITETCDNGWFKVYFGANYDIGYVSPEFVTVGDLVSRDEINKARNVRLSQVVKNGKIVVKEGTTAVKLMPDENSDTIAELSNDAKCKIVSGGTNWTKIILPATNEIGYVHTANVQEIIPEVPKKTESTKKAETKKSAKKAEKLGKAESAAPAGGGSGSALVNQASKYLGIKYVYGGTSPSGFDCSGLVQYCCKKLGVSVGRTASNQFSNGVAVSKDNLKAGDLVFFSRGGRISHVAIYAGNGRVIHAPRTGKTICYQSLSSLCASSKYAGARRVM